MTNNRMLLIATIFLAGVATALPAVAQKTYGPGVTGQEIKIGNIAPYTGL